MPAQSSQIRTNRQSFWPAIIRILLVEIVILLALSGGIVGYLSWSSEAAWAEFKAASIPPAPDVKSPIQFVNRPMLQCDWRA
jgi:hypothetical protein